MKLNVLPARTGWLWVKLGLRTFFRQPLALAMLFVMFVVAVSVASLLPVLGPVLALGLLPAASLGLMAASEQASRGKFPMPSVMLLALRSGPQRLRAMLVLGLLYAAGFMLILGASALFDGGLLARLYIGPNEGLNADMLANADFHAALWVAVLLYLPFSLLFWHAPALVYWHGVAPVKALFFSFVAWLRNLGPLAVFGLCWFVLLMLASQLLVLAATALGGPELMRAAMAPLALLLAAMFSTSIYFTFRDTFGGPPDPTLKDTG
jgi:hypothetical protein